MAPSTEFHTLLYRLEQAEKQIATQNTHIDLLETKLQTMKDEAAKREKKRLLWGIGALGSVVMALGALLWNYRSVIFK